MQSKISRKDIDRKYYPKHNNLLKLGKICEKILCTIGLLYPRKHMTT